VTLAEIRATILERDGYQCVRCGRTCIYDHSIHHRILGNRKDMRASNLITLCGSGTTGCHGWVHSHPQSATDAGWIVSKFRKQQDTPDIPVTYAAAGERPGGTFALADNLTMQAWEDCLEARNA
jgi:hypothetical protein